MNTLSVKRTMVFALSIAIFAAMLTGCGPNSVKTDKASAEKGISELVGYPDFSEIYDGLLKHFGELILEPDAKELPPSDIGVAEAAGRYLKNEVADAIGYAITDVSGDGNPELVIGEINGENENGKCGTSILCVFTADSKKPVFSFGADSQSGYYFTNSGMIYHTASDNDGQTIFGLYTMDESGKSIYCYDFYFNHKDAEHPENDGFYHNVTGEWVTSVSDKMEIKEKDFFEIAYNITTDLKELNFSPFSEYGITVKDNANVTVSFFEDAGLSEGSFVEYTADDDEFSADIVFLTDTEIKDFKLLSLEYGDDGADGISIEAKELYALEALTPEKPLVVSMTFAGDIPGYGISYTDSDGTQKRFSVGISGFDGSLVLSEL